MKESTARMLGTLVGTAIVELVLVTPMVLAVYWCEANSHPGIAIAGVAFWAFVKVPRGAS